MAPGRLQRRCPSGAQEPRLWLQGQGQRAAGYPHRTESAEAPGLISEGTPWGATGGRSERAAGRRAAGPLLVLRTAARGKARRLGLRDLRVVRCRRAAQGQEEDLLL